ncbi:hypothetical protein ACWKWL_06605 [Diaphorobacter nitroreducens]
MSDDKLLNGLRVRELAAIEAFRTGTAGLQEWADMTGVLNVCETMARSGIGPEALEACKKAEQALIDAGVRFESLGRMVLSGEGLQALRDLYAYHDLQRQSVSRAEFWRQIERAQKRVKSKAPEVRDMSEV